MKKVNGWKVISRLDRSSCQAYYWSNGYHRFTLLYPVGVRVTPKVANSKIFFFLNKQDAVNFVGEYSGDHIWEIVPCVAENVSRLKLITVFPSYFSSFWDWKAHKNHRSIREYVTGPRRAVKGTYVADAITCLE